MKKISHAILISFVLVALIFSTVSADYYFSVPSETVDVYYNSDGTMSLLYVYTFENQPSGDPIEYVDLGLPNNTFDLSNVTASVDGHTITDISQADPQYLEGSSNGVTLGLKPYAIQPGQIGTVQVRIDGISNVYYKYSKDETKNYASVRFMPNYFGSAYVTGSTKMRVSLHLPLGVTPDEPQWEQQTTWGGPTDPATALDDEGRVTYTWQYDQADASSKYEFSAAFPATYIPAEDLQTGIQISEEAIGNIICLCVFAVFAAIFGLIIYASVVGAKKRKLAYLPPKIAIEGHGIKRGLTAVEAAILMEMPMDKVLTMILFGVIKKNAATVTSRDPLTLTLTTPVPEGLQPYELEFLEAFKDNTPKMRQKALQEVMVNLVKSISEKMKGFSRKETIAFYDDINERAWKMINEAGTPEVKSQKFDESMEWTMLGKDYENRTRETFSTGPVYVPMWWGRFDPTYHSPVSSAGPSIPSLGGGGGGGKTTITLPTLPGADFAASMVSGVQSAAGGLVGNITDFTSGITNKTNPVPPPTRSSSSGGGGGGSHSCACACACAGCACACAGGGR